MQRTATKLDRPLPLLDFFPPDDQDADEQEVIQDVRSRSFSYGEGAKGKPAQLEPPYQDLHSFVASMWKVASPAKSKTNSVGPKQGQPWQEQQLKIKEEELARKKEELLETRARNKRLERQHRRDTRNLVKAAREVEELQSSNTSLWEELEDVLSINRVADQQQRESQLKISKLYREMIELRRINANLRKELGAARVSQKIIFSYSKDEPQEGLTMLNDIHGPNMAGIVPSQEEATYYQEIDYGSEAASCSGNDSDFCTTGSSVPPLPEIVDLVHFCLAGTVSQWVKGIHAACNPETVEALVLPWLMRKLFGLTSEVVTKRREELGNLFTKERISKSSDASADREFDRAAAEPADNHPRDHHLILFPLSADELKATIDTIMMSLAHSITEHKGLDPSVHAAEKVHGALAKSGFEQIVLEYLHILVYCCCLHNPEVTFSDDLGKMERYNPDLHAEPIGGEPPRDVCVIVFPALTVAPDVDDDGFCDQETTLSRRFVMRKGEGRDRRVCFADEELY